MSEGNGQPRSWFHTLPGILTGIAAILTAATGIFVAMANLNSKSPDPITVSETSDEPIELGDDCGGTLVNFRKETARTIKARFECFDNRNAMLLATLKKREQEAEQLRRQLLAANHEKPKSAAPERINLAYWGFTRPQKVSRELCELRATAWAAIEMRGAAVERLGVMQRFYLPGTTTLVACPDKTDDESFAVVASTNAIVGNKAWEASKYIIGGSWD
jgi:hypothetical protein